MGLKANFSVNSIRARFEKLSQKIDHEYLEALQVVGIQAVNYARNSSGFTYREYQDQSGNLRSSVGFIILKDGKVIDENFESAPHGDENGTGVATGKSHAQTVGANYPNGYVLIIVAGMDYAAAVESKGYDVITGASLFAEEELPKAFAAVRDDLARLRI